MQRRRSSQKVYKVSDWDLFNESERKNEMKQPSFTLYLLDGWAIQLCVLFRFWRVCF